MNRRAGRFAAALALLMFSTTAWGDENFGDLASWVGKYPVREVEGRKVDLLKQPAIAETLAGILSPKDRRRLEGYELSVPIREVAGFLIVERCRAHECPNDRSVVAIALHARKLWVGFHERGEKSVTTRWVAADQSYLSLPQAVQATLTGPD